MSKDYISRNLGGEGYSWTLDFVVFRDTKEGGTMERWIHWVIQYKKPNQKEGLLMALNLLQKWIIRSKEQRDDKPLNWSVGLVGKRVMGKYDGIYRIRHRFQNRRILRIKDPIKIFIEGYGPDTLEALEH